MKRTIQISLFLLFFVLLLAACQKEHTLNVPLTEPPFMPEAPNLPMRPYSYSIENNNNITDEGATLGRVLFYERQLSADHKVTCGSCHKQEFSFADTVQFTKGYKGIPTKRNVPTIINLNPTHDFFWDKREDHLFEMVLKPITNVDEMGNINLDTILTRLRNTDYYPPLFEAAFGTPEITAERMGLALNQFVLSIRSDNSRFDTELNSNYAEWVPGIDPVIRTGQIAFGDRGRCFTCHGGPDTHELKQFDQNGNLIVLTSANIGLDLDYVDPGMGAFDPSKNGEFKVPTLRNIMLTAPYMHDGRFKTIDEVIEHYSEDVEAHPHLDSRLVVANTGKPFLADYTEEEIEGLKAFLHMLTDYDVTTDVKWSNPFRY